MNTSGCNNRVAICLFLFFQLEDKKKTRQLYMELTDYVHMGEGRMEIGNECRKWASLLKIDPS